MIKKNFIIGSPLNEVLKEYKSKIDKSKILEKLKVSKNNYFLFSLHREENVDNDKKFKILISSILKIQKILWL